eukprot:TRINITY_DN69930_c0_g1_i1.p1 TRINITY_DN69930_c0_g1~~TRINITY_DN69930_c0_g1_i1.p1  ORF type:complete len:665 (+),score=146.32 TRINITY_DN69930_c0_g1_i1:68-2062(+)
MTSNEAPPSRSGTRQSLSVRRTLSRSATSVQHLTQSGGAAETVNMFADADTLKDQVRKNIDQRDYDVAFFYKDKGCSQAIARSSIFANAGLLVIMLNALWIGFESEVNDKDNLTQAAWYIQVGEWFFAVFFTGEWLVRFCAFKKKMDGFRDKWFSFDAFLVGLIILETWVMPYVIPVPQKAASSDVESNEDESSNLSQISMLRMLRLLRLTRMVRLMRSVPELVTLLRSMTIALRSVLSTLGLLVIFMYIFAIVFRSQLDVSENEYLKARFGRLLGAMWTLLLSGTLLDNISKCSNELLDVNWFLAMLFVVFIMLACFTVLNMLVGLLCEVVDAVAAAEKERIVVAYVKGKLIDVLTALDGDGNGTISRDEFNTLLEIPEAVNALFELGVDVPNLLSLSDHLFEADEVEEKGPDRRKKDLWSTPQGADQEGDAAADDEDDDDGQVSLTFADFLKRVIRLRSTNQPSVLDMVDLRKLIQRCQRNVTRRLDRLEELNVRLTSEVQMINKIIACLCSHDCMSALSSWCEQADRQPEEEDDEDEMHVHDDDPMRQTLLKFSSAEADFDMWDIAEEGDACWEPAEEPQTKHKLDAIRHFDDREAARSLVGISSSCGDTTKAVSSGSGAAPTMTRGSGGKAAASAAGVAAFVEEEASLEGSDGQELCRRF